MKYILPIVMLALALTILFGAHFSVYKFIVKFFGLEDPLIKKIIFLSLIFLAVSFIIASIITRTNSSAITRGYYIFTGTWYGLMVNLLLTTAFGWLIFYIFKLTGWQINSKLLGIVLYGLAAITTVYGIWNAQSLSVKRIDVSIKNLPSGWEGKTAVQITDVHLGAVYGTNYLQKVINQINKISPDIVFITGDYFDGTCPHLDKLVQPLSGLYPPLGIYFVYGNHETYEGKEKVTAALSGSKVKLLADEIVDVKGLKIIGLDYVSEGLKRDTVIFEQISDNDANVLLYHQPTLINEAKAAGIDLQLSGHAHQGQIFPINIISRLVYGRYFHGFYKDGDYSIYTSSGTGTWGPPIRTSGQNEITVIKFNRKL